MDPTRFAFGDNWSDYAKTADGKALAEAQAGLTRLLPDGFDPNGKSFLDIGCGSGLHSVAAHRLGFSPIMAVDYDDASVATTKALANRFNAPINCFRDDILNSKLLDQFDVVYSWGVLHHTGDMEKAIKNAQLLVKPGGTFIIAIYLKTKFCGMWKVIKRTYSAGSPLRQRPMAAIYIAALKARGLGGVRRDRGMNFYHDAIDWLGGYPYESAHPETIKEIVGSSCRLVKLKNAVPSRGLFGTGCAEYTFEAD